MRPQGEFLLCLTVQSPYSLIHYRKKYIRNPLLVNYFLLFFAPHNRMKIKVSQHLHPGHRLTHQPVMIFLHEAVMVTLCLPLVYRNVVVFVIRSLHCAVDYESPGLVGITRPHLIVPVVLSDFLGLDLKQNSMDIQLYPL